MVHRVEHLHLVHADVVVYPELLELDELVQAGGQARDAAPLVLSVEIQSAFLITEEQANVDNGKQVKGGVGNQDVLLPVILHFKENLSFVV